jgi:hypothetical protein
MLWGLYPDGEYNIKWTPKSSYPEPDQSGGWWTYLNLAPVIILE